ncbi:MAG: DsrE family protein [Thermogutta sp.]
MRGFKVFVGAVAISVAALALAVAPTASGQSRQRVEETQSAVVHLSHFTDDLHRAFMALKVANLMQSRGVKTTLFLDIEGARIADDRQALEVKWGSSEMTLAELYQKFISAGGKVVVCPHCAKAAGLGSEHVRDGAGIATEDELAIMLVTAAKIMDY